MTLKKLLPKRPKRRFLPFCINSTRMYTETHDLVDSNWSFIYISECHAMNNISLLRSDLLLLLSYKNTKNILSLMRKETFGNSSIKHPGRMLLSMHGLSWYNYERIPLMWRLFFLFRFQFTTQCLTLRQLGRRLKILFCRFYFMITMLDWINFTWHC